MFTGSGSLRKWFKWFFFALLFGRAGVVLCPLSIAEADSFSPNDLLVNGHLKYQLTHGENRGESLTELLNSDTTTDQSLDVRLNGGYAWGRLDVDAAGEFLSISGERVRLLRGAPDMGIPALDRGLDGDAHRLFDLSLENDSHDRYAFGARIDRLALRYTQGSVTTRLGRQVVSWGNGLVFQVLDLFHPLSPTVIDREYRTGEDSVVFQWVSAAGDDLQLVALPRRSVSRGGLESRESSFGAKWRGKAISEVQYDVVGAAHYGEAVVGVGLSKSIFEAVVRSDIAIAQQDAGDSEFSFLVNLDRSWELFGRNSYGSVEYFHHSVGVWPSSYASPPGELAERIARGEVFTLGRDYIALGLRLEWSPLVNLFASSIFNLHDASEYLQLRAEYNVVSDAVVIVGLNIPIGGKGSEFGGVILTGGESEVIASPSVEGYVRVACYFGRS